MPVSSGSAEVRRLVWFFLFWAMAAGARAQTAPGDSVTESLHERLRRQDEARYDPELLQTDSALRDSLLTSLDSLGLAGAREKRPFPLRVGFNPALGLWTYNRVEGFLLAAGVDLEGRRVQEPWMQLQGGYAFGSEKFRYRGILRLPLGPEAWGFDARMQFEDRVVPYGSNRPLWNGLRAFVGGEDARDYMGRLGGSAFLRWRRWRSLQLTVGYEAAEESSVSATTEFALLGNMAPDNLPIQDGTDRAIVGTLRLGSLVHHLARLDVEHRVAGGGLGGSFTYNRTDANLAARRYFWRQEFVLQLRYVRTAGTVPVQRLADVGGLSTVRGWRKRAQVGESSFDARLEYLVPYDLFRGTRVPLLRRMRLQLAPWADAARTWDGPSDSWIYAAGLGIQHFLGALGEPTYLRLDVAFPMGPERSRDVRLELHFVRGVF